MSQRTTADTTLIYTKIVERYASFFERPEVRLRFLNGTLAKQNARQAQMHRALRRFAFIEHTRFYRWLLELGLYRLIFHELGRLLPAVPAERRQALEQTKAPRSARIFFRLYQARYAFYTVGLATIGVTLFGLYLLSVWSVRRANTYLTQRYRTTRTVSIAPAQNPAVPIMTAKYLPDYQPEKVWSVEEEKNYERYSNGGRILKDYETDNRPRGYYVFRRGGSELADDRVHQKPIGILYHTSESDLVDFTSDNNSSIQKRTQWLLESVQKKKKYNYVIDRFGQIHRVVRDNQAANHAGNSLWADQRNVYVGLNDSFIGVCFESATDAQDADKRMTAAQLLAGRMLTDILRSRYNIDEANCVTHGLVSVNPTNMMACYHHDWVRGFPFEAMGLSDKYKVAPVSISEYGFTYDEHILEKLGGVMWPGVSGAEAEFQRRAEQAKLKPEAMRRRLQDLYREQYERTRKLRDMQPGEIESLEVGAEQSLARERSEGGK